MFDSVSVESVTSKMQSSMIEELRMHATDQQNSDSENYFNILFQYFAFQSLQNIFCGSLNNGGLHLELLKIECFQSR